ncbi:MAG: tetratricopeptide repeat protein [Bryobacteraceae bacterium]|nr:tetratricopeptide repeat protein [Bryobacteraceae bacterium]
MREAQQTLSLHGSNTGKEKANIVQCPSHIRYYLRVVPMRLMAQTHLALALLVSPLLGGNPPGRFDVRGKVEISESGQISRFPRFATVAIYATSSPYTATTQTDLSGSFRFKNVPEGNYTLDAFGRRGQARFLFQVNAEAAEKSGTVKLKVPLRIRPGQLVQHLKKRFEVSVNQLSVPPKAYQDYQAAEKRVQKEDFDGAIEKLEHAVSIAPQFAAAWSRLGIISFYQNRLEKAESYFRQGLENSPNTIEFQFRLAQILLAQKRPQEALEWSHAAVKLRPEDAASRSQLGMNFWELRDYENAVLHLNEAKRLDPAHFSGPQLALARIYIARKDIPSAMREVKEFVANHPDSGEAEELQQWLEKAQASQRH